MNSLIKIAAGLALAVTALPLAAQEVTREQVEAVVADAFRNAPPELQARVQQDETNAICSQYRGNPPDAEWDAILEREQARIAYPEDGVLMGDWQVALQNANNGWGFRMGDTNPDRVVGGNCYACHQLTEAEVAYGNLGPSLLGYGKDRDIDDELIQVTYDKIYNAQAVLPCSQMPRFGTNGFLTPEQVRDYVAMLLHPESPVNQ
jgi:L-cysteine S-thiosulfotransferase